MSWSDLGVPEPSGNEAPKPKAPRTKQLPQTPKPARDGSGRPPIALLVIAGILLVAVVVALVLVFAQPGDDPAAPAPGPTTAAPAPTPTTSPTADPDEAGDPVAMTVGASGFTLVDDKDRTTFTFAWRDDVQDAVSALTEAFGAEPTVRIEPGDGSQYPDYTVYQWQGFMLFDMIPPPGGVSRDAYPQPTYVLFSRNTVGDIAISGEHGLEIGSSIAEVRAAGPGLEIPRGNVGAIRFIFDPGRSNGVDPLQYSMAVDTDGTTVTAILYYSYADI